MKEPENPFGLPKLDDLFTTQEEREEAKLKKIEEIPLDLIDPFPDHPFQVRDDEDMMSLAESIKEHGILTPATLRKKEDGRYEILSGHRRKRAAELAGLKTLRAEVVEMDRDAAVIFMVDSNLQRTRILPSEKAFAYKMRLEAMKYKAGRPIHNFGPVGQNNSRLELSEKTGESERQIQRYIRLTNLIPELLAMVDEGHIALRPAVELSYLPEASQKVLAAQIGYLEATPSLSQAQRMRKMLSEGKLTPEVIEAIMTEEKSNQKEKLVLKGERFRSLMPAGLSPKHQEEYVLSALRFYNRYRQKSHDEREER